MNKVRESFEQKFSFGTEINLYSLRQWMKEFDNLDLVPIEKKEPEIEPCYLHPDEKPRFHQNGLNWYVSCAMGGCWIGPSRDTTFDASKEWFQLMRLARGVR